MSNSPQDRRVVVTGMGVIHQLGKDVESYWSSLVAGKSGIGSITRFDATDYASKVGSEINDFDPAAYMDPKEARRTDRYVQFAVAATKVALKHGGVDVTKLDADRFGVVIGSGVGGMETIDEQSRRLLTMGPRKVSPFSIPSLIANMAAGIVAIEVGARGPNFSTVSACASSTHAIGESLRMIRSGEADIMICGGSEAAITPLGYASFCSMKAMSTDFNDTPERSSRPFDKLRDGFVMGEGAGVLIIETLEHAQARGATILCELAGYGATCDAYHITSPHPEGLGLANCMNRALKDANASIEDVTYINAHGTSTQYNDKFETLAVKKVFGDHSSKLLMSSTKSMTGHLLGGAGAIEAIACVQSIVTGDVPPTINYEEPDPDCDLNYVPNKAVKAEVKVAASNNLGFGGHNATLVFRALS